MTATPLTDISCEILGLRMRSPLILASGIIGTSVNLLERAALCGAGGVTSKSCGMDARLGHPNPVALDLGCGVINAIGLTNPGARKEVALLRDAKVRLSLMGVPVIASIFASTIDQFAQVAEIISQAEPDLIEVNISCPNVGDEFGTPFAGAPETAAAVTEKVKKATSVPICIKLAPNVPNIMRIAMAVVAAGADAITAVNTMPGMLINAYAAKPVLSNRFGGISGRALKPIALRCVAEIRQVVNVPIIGTGGVTTGVDAAEMLMAGATAVGVGTAVWEHGPEVFGLINSELASFMTQEGYENLASLQGKALH